MKPSDNHSRRPALVANRLALGAMVIVFGGFLACGDGRPKRLPESGFQVAFESHKVPAEMKIGETTSADITVRNTSPVSWPSQSDERGRYGVNLAYHWLTEKGTTVVFDGLRTSLPKDLEPGEAVDLKARIQTPERPGRYILEVTLVQERSAWFPEKNGGKLMFPVTVFDRDEGPIQTAGVAPARTRDNAATQGQETRSDKKPEKPLAEKSIGKPPPMKSAAVAINTKKPTPAAGEANGSWTVQLGSFPKKDVAIKLATNLKQKGYDAYVTVTNIQGKEWHRVRVGRFERRAEAEQLRETLRVAEKWEHSIVTSR
jgi:cell division septation protein DedD